MVSLGVFKFDKVEDICLHNIYDGGDFKIIWLNGKCGLWSVNLNKPLLYCQYDSFHPIVINDSYIGEYVNYFKVGVSSESDGIIRYGIFDVKRNCFIIGCDYFSIEPIISLEKVFGFFVTKQENYKLGILDKDGKIICPIVFDGHLELKSFDDSTPRQEKLFVIRDEDWQGKPLATLYFVLKKEKGYQIFNQRGEAISDSSYSSVKMIDTGRHHHSDYGGWIRRDVIFIVCFEELYGVISETGKELVPCSYETIGYDPHMDVMTMKKGGDYSVYRINHDAL